MRPTPQIMLFGNEEGSAEIASELNLMRVTDVDRSQFGTPLLSSMFSLAAKHASTRLLCYVNADIMLTSRFMEALRVVSSRMSQFLITGSRTNVDLNKPWDFDCGDWEETLHRYAAAEGKLEELGRGMDYFAFPRGAFPDMPPYAVGRGWVDFWLLYSTHQRGIPLVDATHHILAVHQYHGGPVESRHGHETIHDGPETTQERQLWPVDDTWGCYDATHVLKSGRLSRAWGPLYLWRRLDRLPLFHSILVPLKWLGILLAWGTRPVRQKFGWSLWGIGFVLQGRGLNPHHTCPPKQTCGAHS